MNERAPVPASSADTSDGPRHGVLHYVWQTISWLLLIAAFSVLCAVILIPRMAGAQAYTVLTGSMRPDYPPGTLIVVKPQPASQIGVGDVITYQIRSGEPDVVTHRVIDVAIQASDGERRFTTQGDANNAADPGTVRPEQIRGELWYSLPYIGYVNNWVTSQKRTVIIFAVAGALFVYAAWQFWAARHDPADDDTNNVDDTDGGAVPPAPAADKTLADPVADDSPTEQLPTSRTEPSVTSSSGTGPGDDTKPLPVTRPDTVS